MGNEGRSAGGVGFVGLLQLLFIGLKLCKVIDWSWWWVLAPTWISVLLLIVVIVIICIVFGVKRKKGGW